MACRSGNLYVEEFRNDINQSFFISENFATSKFTFNITSCYGDFVSIPSSLDQQITESTSLNYDQSLFTINYLSSVVPTVINDTSRALIPTGKSFNLITRSGMAITAQNYSNTTQSPLISIKFDSSNVNQNFEFVALNGKNEGYIKLKNTNFVIVCINNNVFIQPIADNGYNQKAYIAESYSPGRLYIRLSGCYSNL